jgi:hypothetical protein
LKLRLETFNVEFLSGDVLYNESRVGDEVRRGEDLRAWLACKEWELSTEFCKLSPGLYRLLRKNDELCDSRKGLELRKGELLLGDKYELLYALCLNPSLTGEEFLNGEVLLKDEVALNSLLGETERYIDKLDCKGVILSTNSL